MILNRCCLGETDELPRSSRGVVDRHLSTVIRPKTTFFRLYCIECVEIQNIRFYSIARVIEIGSVEQKHPRVKNLGFGSRGPPKTGQRVSRSVE